MASDNSIFVLRLTEAQGELFAFIASMLPLYPSDVADVVQEVNLAMVQRAGDYDASRPFKPWMLQFARHKVWHFLRSRRREQVLFDDELIEKSVEYLADEQDGSETKEGTFKRLAVCKSRLNERQKKLIEMRYTACYSVEEIAKCWNEKLTRIASALVYIRSKLSDCLRRLCRLDDEEFEKEEVDGFGILCNDLIERSDNGTLQGGVLRIGKQKTAYKGFLDELRISERILKPQEFLRAKCRPGLVISLL